MAKEYSPFTPGIPVPIEFFVGRSQEIGAIVSSVKKSVKLNTIERLFVKGDRGIGKSSICNYALNVVEKDLAVLGLHVYMGGVNTCEEMIRRIFERLLRESVNKPWYSKVKNFLGNHVRQLDLFGISVEFSASDQQLERVVNDFLPALRNLLNQLAEEKKGILLILDDINGIVTNPRFANWLKSFVDESATSRDPIPLTLVLVGIPERRDQLVQNQPSLDRVFDIVEINKFSEPETKEFFIRAFGKVNVKVEDKALDNLWFWSEGYPVFMHELGDAVFKQDSDDNIDSMDANLGTIRAVSVIGTKYIETKILTAIRSDNYRHILTKIVGKLGYNFSRKEAIEHLSSSEMKVFDNFLRRMENLGVILKDKNKDAGSYRFSSELYHLFFMLQAGPRSQSS